MAGKTRLVVQVLSEGWAGAPLWLPSDDDGIVQLVDSGQDPVAGTVVFLDDVDRFLSNSSLTLTLLDRWLTAGCLVVTTMTSAKYAQWRDDASKKLPGWDVLNRFKKIHISALPTEGELAAMRSTPYADLIPAARTLGLPAILGGAPPAREKFRDGAEDRSGGWALVRAAADWHRVGLGPATTQQLQGLAEAYPDAQAGDIDWDVAWEWARRPVNHTVALLRRTEGQRWEVLEPISDEADWPLHDRVLRAMSGAGLTPSQSLTLAMRAYLEARYVASDWVVALLNQALLDDSQRVRGRASHFLAAILFDERRDLERVDALMRQALDCEPSEPTFLGSYAIFLTDVRKNQDRAEEMFERALTADPNHANTLGNYAKFLFVRRQDTEGERYAARALELATEPDQLPLRAECNFYFFMHVPARRQASGSELRVLLSKGVSTGAWDFTANLARVIADADPRTDLLTAVAAALGAGDATALSGFAEWRDLPPAVGGPAAIPLEPT